MPSRHAGIPTGRSALFPDSEDSQDRIHELSRAGYKRFSNGITRRTNRANVACYNTSWPIDSELGAASSLRTSTRWCWQRPARSRGWAGAGLASARPWVHRGVSLHRAAGMGAPTRRQPPRRRIAAAALAWSRAARHGQARARGCAGLDGRATLRPNTARARRAVGWPAGGLRPRTRLWRTLGRPRRPWSSTPTLGRNRSYRSPVVSAFGPFTEAPSTGALQDAPQHGRC
jgi:hypothetical protein